MDYNNHIPNKKLTDGRGGLIFVLLKLNKRRHRDRTSDYGLHHSWVISSHSFTSLIIQIWSTFWTDFDGKRLVINLPRLVVNGVTEVNIYEGYDEFKTSCVEKFYGLVTSQGGRNFGKTEDVHWIVQRQRFVNKQLKLFIESHSLK